MKPYNYHYVYRITNIKEKMYYYGVHSCNCLPKEDIGVKYYSSSSIDWFIQDQKINKQDYKYKIVKLFPTRDEANKYESMLLYKFKVTKNDKFYNKAIYCNNTLYGDCANMITVYDLSLEKYVRVNVKIYRDNDNLKHIWELPENKDNVTCFDKNTNIHTTVSKFEFDSNPDLVGVNYGKVSGSNNPNANIINIFNHKHELIYTFNGNYNKSSNINIPYPAFSLSYKNNGQPLGLSKQSRTELRKNCFQTFIGWYALMNNEQQKFNNIIDFDIELEQKTGLCCKIPKGRACGARNARAKTFILEHNNIKYTVVGEINKFCEEHNISLNALKSHRGEYITLAMIGSNHRYEKVKNTIGWKLYE